MNSNPKVDFYFSKTTKWREELKLLRSIVLSCGLTENLKWGVPCYTLDEKNIVLLHVFKDYCAILFFKGALLADINGILVQQTKNVQAARQIRFSGAREIVNQKTTIKAYIYEAIEAEKAGLKVDLKQTQEFESPDEFNQKLKTTPGLKKAFEALTPGRQRAYLLYFSAAKQAKTREARVHKYLAQILKGKGLDDN